MVVLFNLGQSELSRNNHVTAGQAPLLSKIHQLSNQSYRVTGMFCSPRWLQQQKKDVFVPCSWRNPNGSNMHYKGGTHVGRHIVMRSMISCKQTVWLYVPKPKFPGAQGAIIPWPPLQSEGCAITTHLAHGLHRAASTKRKIFQEDWPVWKSCIHKQ